MLEIKCVSSSRKPVLLSLNMPTPTEPIIKSGPEVLVKASKRSPSVLVHELLSRKPLTIFAPTG